MEFGNSVGCCCVSLAQEAVETVSADLKMDCTGL